MKMSKESTNEYTLKMRERYSAMLSKTAKSRVLDDFCLTTSYERKYAIKLLNKQNNQNRKKSGRKIVYTNDVRDVVYKIWMMSDQLCSKLMKPVIDSYLESYEKNIKQLDDEIRNKVLSISPATIDRLLSDDRIETSKWRRRRVNTRNIIQSKVPIRTGPWDVNEPGWLEADGVSHGGNTTAGNFIWSITYKDIHSAWTESRAVWNKGAVNIKKRTLELMDELPFTILGLDVDNGCEFLNSSIYQLCRDAEPRIEFTRSRPYHKNDNAHVEQRNYTHVRSLLGYDRLEDPNMVELINDLYKNEWSLLKNLYCPTMQLISKHKIGSKYKKKYSAPKTPCQRLLESDTVSNEQKQKLRDLLESSDPYILKQRIEEQLDVIFNFQQKKITRRN
jgi:hypothetical protein